MRRAYTRIGSSLVKAVRRILISLALVVATPAVAHHSGAIFDSATSLTLSGTVKEFQWTNPHCWIQLLVNAGDTTQEWSVEMGAPLQVYGGGWRPSTLKRAPDLNRMIHGDCLENDRNPVVNGETTIAPP